MKSKKILSMLIAFVLIATMATGLGTIAASATGTTEPTDAWSAHVADAFAGGNGTELNPYRIQTEEQLAKLSSDVAGGEEYTDMWFKLTDNLDLSAYRWIPIGQYRWESNGTTTSKSFQGNFDGNGKTIKGIYVSEQKDAVSGGLFGYVVSNSALVIRDVTIENAVIYGAEQGLAQGYNGILSAKMLANEGHSLLVENVTVSGTVSIVGTEGYYVAGGMVGDASRVKFVDCNVIGLSMTAVSNSGGFAGMVSNCYFEDCRATGKVSGGWAMGGFVGMTTLSTVADPNTNSTFVRCISDVEVTANDWNVGGFIGYSEGGAFEHCAVLGDVHSTTNYDPRVGGFVGYVAPVSNGGYEYGGVDVVTVLESCVVAGAVTAEHSSILPSALVGGTNASNLTVINCAYNSEKNANANVISEPDGTPITTITATALSSAQVMDVLCSDYLYGHHQYAGNICKICGLEHFYINDDGYWVIDGTVTDVKAQGVQGEKGDTGEQGTQGEKGEDGVNGENADGSVLLIVVCVVASVALVGVAVLAVLFILDKKKRV